MYESDDVIGRAGRLASSTVAIQPTSRPLRFGMVGTYPPTRCGIASFTASLARAIAGAATGCQFGVVACVDAHAPAIHSSQVVTRLVAGSLLSHVAAVDALTQFDVVLVQHEFGIYGGADGSAVVDLVGDLREAGTPSIVVVHTVPTRPEGLQRCILEELASLADRVVVQSSSARSRLLAEYDVDPEQVQTIPHGAHANTGSGGRLATPGAAGKESPPVVLTWGLMGRDKGIELGIEAIARLGDLEPQPTYVVIGQTHPRVKDAEGEAYRESLVELATAVGVADRVEFDDGYHDMPSIQRRIREADVVLLPYRSREQVVSGVLVEAIASGKPVVATRFPHAVELVSEGSGLLVPHDDPEAIASALRALLTDRELMAKASAVARRQAARHLWENVGRSYLALVGELVPWTSIAVATAQVSDVSDPRTREYRVMNGGAE